MKKYLSLFFICLISACSTVTPVDYSKTEHWLARPEKTTKEVDLFYLYPTVWYKVSPNEPNTCEIDNKIMVKRAKMALKMQASVFKPMTNTYAPYYRQGDASHILSLPFAERTAFLEEITEQDVIAAFDYYIKNDNNGRPFILAGHSQGAMMLQPILFKYMKENPDVYKRMIAAYPIGYAFTQEDLNANPHLKFAEKANDTGVIISYNTEGLEIASPNPLVAPNSIVINPITWTRGEKEAPASKNLGSVFFDKKGKPVKKMNFANARVDLKKGAVICSTAECASTTKAGGLFPKGVYHGSDIAFYYYNLRQNAKDRIKAYFAEQKK